MMTVSNTSPIVNLAVIGQVELLQKLFQKIVIPQAVYHEIVVVGAGKPGAQEVETLGWFESREVHDRALVETLRKELDGGEAEAIALAVENKADLLLLDERSGREVAARYGIQQMGVLDIIIYGKKRGYLTQVRPLLDKLRAKAGFWISPSLYQYAVTTAGEYET